ncbi:MAG: hypothetical protein ACRBBP_09200 [Bdellovibrionales bacterium]
MKHIIYKLFICVSLLITATTHAEVTENGSFEVFTNNGQRVHYNAKTQVLSVFDINGQLKASGETNIVITNITGSETVSSTKHSYSFNTAKENFTLTVSTVAFQQGAELIETNSISRAELVQRSHRTFLGHEFRSSILVDEFTKRAAPERSFAVTTVNGEHALYDALNHTMTISNIEGQRPLISEPVQYARRYHGNIVLHLFSISRGSRKYTVEFFAEITDRKIHKESLIRVHLVREKPGIILSERFTSTVEIDQRNAVEFDPTIKRPLRCKAVL